MLSGALRGAGLKQIPPWPGPGDVAGDCARRKVRLRASSERSERE